VRARDCVASLNRWSKRDSFGQFAATLIDEMSARDDKTLVIRLKQAFPGLLQAIGKPSSNVPFIMPERIANTDANAQISVDTVVGSGPFKFERSEFRPGNSMVWTKNPDYEPRQEPPSWSAGGKVAKVDRVEWRIVPDARDRVRGAAGGRGRLVGTAGARPDRRPAAQPQRQGRDPRQSRQHGDDAVQPPAPAVSTIRACAARCSRRSTSRTYLAAMMGSEPELARECFSVFTCGTPFASDVRGGGGEGPQPRARQADAACRGLTTASAP
jgi:peptide/nickel transport system substrate-binding protein